MSSTAGDVLPALPPIRTTATATPPAMEEDARSSPAAESSSTAPDAESRPSPAAGKWEEEVQGEEAEAEPTTPTSEESRLQAPTECPPAPRKPKWAPPPALAAKRKLASTSAAPSPPRRAFFPVARDLSTVFRSLPPKKRIRAG